MRGAASLPVLLALAVLLAVAPAAAQSPTAPAATATLDIPEPGPANGTAVVPFQVTLSVSGLLCPEDATFTVPVRVSNATHAVALHPDPLTFVVPAGQSYYGYTQSRAVALTVGPAPPGTTERLLVVAGPPAGGCAEAVSVQREGDAAEVTVAWPTVPAKPPGQAMSAPLWPAVLASIWAPGWFSRRVGLNSRLP